MPEPTTLNVMGGCRVAAGGLHLGHYLGCFKSLESVDRISKYFFVLRDRGSVFSDEHQEGHIVDTVANIMATSYGNNVIIVLQSDLFPKFGRLVDTVASLTTLAQLQNVYPQHRALRRNKANPSVLDFMFPIESACTYFLLDADFVAMNDDSRRFVSFARRIAKKIKSAAGRPVVKQPTLVHGPIPRLLGFNYEKMSKSRTNAIFLSDDDDTLNRKINSLFDFAHLFRHFPEEEIKRKSQRDDYILPQSFLPFCYIEAFGSPEDQESAKKLRQLGDRDKLRAVVGAVLNRLIGPLRARSTEIRMHRTSDIWNRLEVDRRQALEVASRVWDRFR